MLLPIAFKRVQSLQFLTQNRNMFQSSVDMDRKVQKQQQVYKRVRLLGAGAYGKAYLVKEISTEQQYVIKQILMADMSLQEQENALRQAKILEALSHPNIIRFKEVYRTSKMRLNIVMEYADEGDLASKIKHAKKQSQHFEETQILDWFTQICLGIKHIHDRKIIHRDLKAQNIFLTSDKIIKIGDFGVSRVLEKTAMNARTVVGSPYYLSPEIIENKPYSFQTDIWSLGALLYQMCALNPPFVANNLQFLALKIVKGAYGQIPTQYSYDLKSLIKSMLNTDSNKRPNINKILTSKVISKRISSFLTESKRIDQFSHTVIHNKNIFQAKFPPKQKNGEQALKPPPNLICIEKDMENKSQIVLSNANFELQSSPKSRPFTPLIVQQRKGPNNFFNNNNKKPTKKMISHSIQKAPSLHNLNLNGLMQIKPSALQEKVKLPKVQTNPHIFERRQSQACIKKNNSGFDHLQEKKIPTSAFIKKREQSKQIFPNGAVVQTKREIERFEKEEEEKRDDLVGMVGKWKKTPKILEKIETPPQNQDNKTKNLSQNTSNITIPFTNHPKIQPQVAKNQQVQSKPITTKVTSHSSSRRHMPNTVKKNLPKKQIKDKQKKTANITNKKSVRKESEDITPTFEVVSEEIKKKTLEDMTKRRSASKTREGEKRKAGQKKTVRADNVPVGIIRKPPVQSKGTKKPVLVQKTQQKLSQPPRLEFQNQNEFQSPQKLGQKILKDPQETIHELEYESSIIEQEKCNSDRSPDDLAEDMYSCEQFECYNQTESNMRRVDEEQRRSGEYVSDSEGEQHLSLNLSESGRTPANQNFNRMLQEMENIRNMITIAEGVIETLPVFGQDLIDGRKLLELSQPAQDLVRDDDSEMDSVVCEQIHTDIINQTQTNLFGHKPQECQQIDSYSSSSSHHSTSANLTLFSNQQYLETLKMNLEELFGQHTIISIHQFVCEVVEKEGLDFNEKDVQRMILFQMPQINTVLLKKYFRLIVTVVIMEQQENAVE